MTNEDLKPCKMCGSKDISWGKICYGHGDSGDQLICNGCPMRVADYAWQSKRDAIEAWNRMMSA